MPASRQMNFIKAFLGEFQFDFTCWFQSCFVARVWHRRLFGFKLFSKPEKCAKNLKKKHKKQICDEDNKEYCLDNCMMKMDENFNNLF